MTLTKTTLNAAALALLASTDFAIKNEYTLEQLTESESCIAEVLSGAAGENAEGIIEHEAHDFKNQYDVDYELLKVVEFDNKFFMIRISDANYADFYPTLAEAVEDFNNTIEVLGEIEEIVEVL